MKTINLNDQVEVVLTGKGAEILNHIYKTPGKYYDGENYRTMLWLLMVDLGGRLIPGSFGDNLLFKTNIKVLDRGE